MSHKAGKDGKYIFAMKLVYKQDKNLERMIKRNELNWLVTLGNAVWLTFEQKNAPISKPSVPASSRMFLKAPPLAQNAKQFNHCCHTSGLIPIFLIRVSISHFYSNKCCWRLGSFSVRSFNAHFFLLDTDIQEIVVVSILKNYVVEEPQ